MRYTVYRASPQTFVWVPSMKQFTNSSRFLIKMFLNNAAWTFKLSSFSRKDEADICLFYWNTVEVENMVTTNGKLVQTHTINTYKNTRVHLSITHTYGSFLLVQQL